MIQNVKKINAQKATIPLKITPKIALIKIFAMITITLTQKIINLKNVMKHAYNVMNQGIVIIQNVLNVKNLKIIIQKKMILLCV